MSIEQPFQLHLPPKELQIINEKRFNPKHIDGRIRDEISATPANAARRSKGVELITEWMQEDWYPSKRARLDQLVQLDLEELVTTIFTGIAYCQVPVLFTSISAQLAGRLGFSDKVESLTTIAELLAVLCETDAFDIVKPSRQASLQVVSQLELSEGLAASIDNATFLPPLVCPPKTVTCNHESGYYTHNDSLLLGKGNHHNGDLCLDVINLQNAIPLRFDLEFLCAVEEQPNTPITMENIQQAALEEGVVLTNWQAKEEARIQQENWLGFKTKSYEYYTLLAKQGNRMWFTHKWDKRGRLYTVGYHISYQSTSFKKASLELADEEIVAGI